MRVKFSSVLFFISIVFFIGMAVFSVYRNLKTGHNFSCLAVQSTAHGDFFMQGNFDFLFKHGKGRIRINGSTTASEKRNIVSRQIFFTYTHHDTDFILNSQQVQIMNNKYANIANRDFNHHFPAFFSQEGKLLAMAIRQDRSGNYVMYFADVPVFYCQPKK